MNYFKNLFNALISKKKIPEKIPERQVGIYTANINEMDERTLLNFRNTFSQPTNANNGGIVFADNVNGISTSSFTSSVDPKEKITKIAVTPISILNEIEMDVNPFSLQNLDDKIAIINEKIKLIKQSYAKREVTALLLCLENRKKFYTNDKNGEPFNKFFEKFKTTTDEKIDNVLKKYELVIKESDIFIPEFPDEAIKTMKEYKEKVVELCGKEPQFLVIATEDSFKKNYEKRDPILLALSPFGFFYYVLGAWDREMICLTDL